MTAGAQIPAESDDEMAPAPWPLSRLVAANDSGNF